MHVAACRFSKIGRLWGASWRLRFCSENVRWAPTPPNALANLLPHPQLIGLGVLFAPFHNAQKRCAPVAQEIHKKCILLPHHQHIGMGASVCLLKHWSTG